MKTRLFLITIVLLNTVGISFTFLKRMDTVERSSIKVVNSKGNFYSLGSAEDLQKAFGKASIEKSEDEVLGGYAYFYTYNGLEVYFNEKNFEDITIKKPGFRVLLKGKEYKVGDNIQKLNKDFPISFKNREQRSVSSPEGIIHLGITFKNKLTDAYVAIIYNKEDLITEIWIGNNNS